MKDHCASTFQHRILADSESETQRSQPARLRECHENRYILIHSAYINAARLLTRNAACASTA